MITDSGKFVKLEEAVLRMDMPAEAKLLYAILADRVSYSQYKDASGQYYFLGRADKEELMTITACKKDTFQKNMRLLRSRGLITTAQHGRGNRIYLVNRSLKKSATEEGDTAEVTEKIASRSLKKSMTEVTEKINDPLNKTNTNKTNLNQTDISGSQPNTNSYNSTNGAADGKNQPTFMDVLVYWRLKNYHSNPADFHTYYELRGWKIRGEPVNDWRKLADRWERREL